MFKEDQLFSARSPRESGLTLVEVVVAIALILIVATSSATLSFQAIASTASQERRQIAVTVANGALEEVNAQSVKVASTGVSGLYTGRTQSLVTTAFTASASYPGVASTYPGWDPTANGSSTQTLKISNTSIQSGTTFDVKTLFGPCFQATSGGDCGRISGYASAPATAPFGYSALIRVIVVVTWTAGCGVSTCSYTAGTLIDPHTDLAWISHG